MKTYEYAEIYRLKSEEDWRNHFRDNLLVGRSSVAMYSCPECKEILSGTAESTHSHECLMPKKEKKQ